MFPRLKFISGVILSVFLITNILPSFAGGPETEQAKTCRALYRKQASSVVEAVSKPMIRNRAIQTFEEKLNNGEYRTIVGKHGIETVEAASKGLIYALTGNIVELNAKNETLDECFRHIVKPILSLHVDSVLEENWGRQTTGIALFINTALSVGAYYASHQISLAGLAFIVLDQGHFFHTGINWLIGRQHMENNSKRKFNDKIDAFETSSF